MRQENAASPHTGWKAAQASRRPHAKRRLKMRQPPLKPSKKRRTQSKNRRAAMRAQGVL